LKTDPKCLDGKNDDSLIKFLIDNHKNDKSYISAEAEIMAKCEERLKKKTEENLSFFQVQCIIIENKSIQLPEEFI